MIENAAPQGALLSKFPHNPSEAVALLDSQGIIRFATTETAQFYGHPVDQMVGHPALRFIVPADHEHARAQWRQLLSDDTQQSIHLQVRIVTADGRRIPSHISLWRLPDRESFLALHHIGERVRDRLETLYAIQSMVSQTLDTELLLDIVLREIPRLIPCKTSTIYILEPNQTVQVRRWQGEIIEQVRSLIHERLADFETSRILRETNRPLVIRDTERDPHWITLPNHRPIRSWLGVPLNHQGQFMGEINLDSPEPNQFTEEDAELVQALANQVAASLYHARLYAEEQKRAERYQGLNEISQAISQLDLRSVLELVYQNVSRLMDTSTFFIGLVDVEANRVKLVGSYDFGQPRPDEYQAADRGITGLVLQTRKPLIIHDTTAEPLPEQIIIQDEMPGSILMLPLITQDEIVGVISVQSYRPHAYSADDIALLETIAGAVATAVRNAQLYEQTADRLHALETLHEMSIALAATQEPQAIARLIVRAASELFSPTESRLILIDGPGWSGATWTAYHDTASMQVSEQIHAQVVPLAQRVCETHEPLIIPDCSQDTENRSFGCEWPVAAAIVCPIRRANTTFGAIALYYDEPQFFRQDMRRILDLLCLQSATAFENARYTIKMQRSLAEVSALHELARRVSAMNSLDDILNAVVETIRTVYQTRSASLALLDETANEAVTMAASGLEPRYMAQGRFKFGEYVAGEVISTGKVIYVPDTFADPRFRIIDPGIRSLLTVPLTVHGHTIGTLSIDSERPNAFTRDHERVLTIAGGQIAAAIETVRLLDETRQRADALAQANAQLEAQDRLRKELVYQISHDLRTPLQIVYGYAGMLQSGDLGPITRTQRDVLDLIIKRSRSIERMTKDIMAVKPIDRDTLELATLNLNEICQQAMGAARVMHQERDDLQFVTELTQAALPVEADFNRLLRVLDNLIDNAVKFSPKGGTITLRTGHEDGHQRVVVSVSDEGIGIPPDQLPYVFERFYRGHRMQFTGSGLGLYNVQQIIHAHEGEVWAASQPGQGTTISFALPLAER